MSENSERRKRGEEKIKEVYAGDVAVPRHLVPFQYRYNRRFRLADLIEALA